MIAQMWHRLRLMFAQGVGQLTTQRKVQMTIFDGDTPPDVNRVEPYGISYRPPLPGFQSFAIFPAGDRSKGFALVIGDTRYEFELLPGEVAIHTWKDKEAHRHHIYLKNDGSIEVMAKNITVKASETALIKGDVVAIHASSLFRFDCNGHGQKWYPTKVDTYQIGEAPGTTNNISPPEI